MDKKLQKLKKNQDDVMGEMAGLLSALSSPVRIKLVHFLSQGPLKVETLAERTGESVANTSMHLRKMHVLGAVSVEVAGKYRLYSLHPAAFAFWEACQDFAQAVIPGMRLDVAGLYGDIEWSENLASTLRMVKRGEALLVDARPAGEGEASLPGLAVVHIPAGEIEGLKARLPKDRPVLVFCRGRLCALSAFAVGELRKRGYRAYRLNESWYSLSGAT